MKQMKEANAMVEEFMLFANVSVAKKIYNAFQQCSMLRCHVKPPPSRFEAFITAMASRGFQVAAGTSKELADSLDAAVVESDPFFNTLARMMATRCMMPAEYFCSGTVPYAEFFHYGLAMPIYTHFTSPIRRYPGSCPSMFCCQHSRN